MPTSSKQSEYLKSRGIEEIPVGTLVMFKPDSHYFNAKPKRFIEQIGVVVGYRFCATEPIVVFEKYKRWDKVTFTEVNPKYLIFVNEGTQNAESSNQTETILD